MTAFIKAAPAIGMVLILTLLAIGCAAPRSHPRPVVKPPSRPSETIEPVKPPPRPQQPVMVKAGPVPSAPAPLKTKPFVHTVRNRGETLIAIAAWYTGSGRNWERVAQANPGLNPNLIPIGADIRIPEKLVVKHQPMPDVTPPPAVPGTGKTRRAQTPGRPSGPVQAELFGPAVRKAEPAPVELFGPSSRPAEPAQVELFGPIEQAPLPRRQTSSGLPVQLESLE